MGSRAQKSIFSFKDYVLPDYQLYPFILLLRVLKNIHLPMLAVVTIKNKSKAKFVNFISKAHVTDFTICIYLEIIEVGYFYIF